MASLDEQFSGIIDDILGLLKSSDLDIDAFSQLRRICVHAAKTPDVFDRKVLTSLERVAVVSSLVDFSERHKIRNRQVHEVVPLLLTAPAWKSAVEQNPDLLVRLQEMPESVCAPLGLMSVSQQPRQEPVGCIAPQIQAPLHVSVDDFCDGPCVSDDDVTESFLTPFTRPAENEMLTWMYYDTNPLAKHNPLRWSGNLHLGELLHELSGLLDANKSRPLKVKGSKGWKHRFASANEALASFGGA